MPKKKNDIVSELSKLIKLPKTTCSQFVKAYSMVLLKLLKTGDKIYICDIGTFKTVMQRARPVRNPKTKEEMTLPERNKIVFKASAPLKRWLIKNS